MMKEIPRVLEYNRAIVNVNILYLWTCGNGDAKYIMMVYLVRANPNENKKTKNKSDLYWKVGNLGVTLSPPLVSDINETHKKQHKSLAKLVIFTYDNMLMS